MVTIDHKRGDTLKLYFEAMDDENNRVNLSGYIIRSQARHKGQLLGEATIKVIDELKGEFSATFASTTAWPVARVVQDVQYTSPSGQIESSQTIVINVIEDVTYD